MKLQQQWTPLLGRKVSLRPDSSDRQVWADTFTGLYHLPPPEMAQPGTVLDLGANIGLTAAHYQSLWPDATILAVEMDADCCELIRINAPGVGLGQYAVSAEGGIGVYNPDLLAEAYAFSQPGVSSIADSVAILNNRPVMSHRLRQIIFQTFGEDGVDFVKMDVEGAEWGIFEYGEWAPFVRNLVVELHDGADSEALIARALLALERLGFRARYHPPHPQAVYAWR